MAQRVSDGDVRAIIQVDDTVEMYPFIQSASTLVDTQLASSGLTGVELFEVERWLSAHFVAMVHPPATEVGTGVYRVKLESGSTGQGLRSTRYGQLALALDRTGTLARVAQGAMPARFEVL